LDAQRERKTKLTLLGVPGSDDDGPERLPSLLEQSSKSLVDLVGDGGSGRRIGSSQDPGVSVVSDGNDLQKKRG